MPNTNYQRGRNHEYYIKQKYEDLNFFVIRSAGSKGPVDLIAIKRGPWCSEYRVYIPIVIGIQCKTGNSPLLRADWAKLDEWAENTGGKVKVE